MGRSEFLYKGSICLRPPFSELAGRVLSIHIAIEALLRRSLKKKHYQDEDIDASLRDAVRLLKDIRNQIAHEPIDNNQRSLHAIVDGCERFVEIVRQLEDHEDSADYQRHASPLDHAGQVLFDAILQFYMPEIEHGIVLDGLYLPGQKNLDARVRALLSKPS